MAVGTKVKKVRKKSKVQGIIDRIIKLFLDNPDHRFPAEEIAEKILGASDYKSCRVIACGYIPEVRRELEEHHNATLDNLRKLGWKLTSGGFDTFIASGQAEKMMVSYKNSYKRKMNTYDLDKFPEPQRTLIVEEMEAIPDIERMIARLYRIRAGVEKIAIEERQKKIHQKEIKETAK